MNNMQNLKPTTTTKKGSSKMAKHRWARWRKHECSLEIKTSPKPSMLPPGELLLSVAQNHETKAKMLANTTITGRLKDTPQVWRHGIS